MPEPRPTYRRFLRLLCRGIYGLNQVNAGGVASGEGLGKAKGLAFCEANSRGQADSGLGGGLSERQWYKIIEEAEKHTVSGVVFDAVASLPEAQMPPLTVLAQWLAMADREARKYEAMSDTLSRLLGLFGGRGLHPVLQKGHAVARFYPQPALRSFGDIDLWFPNGERAAADKAISSYGIKVDSTADSGSRYAMGGTEVEHHSSLIEIHNPFKAGYLKNLYEAYPPKEITLPTGLSAAVPSPMVELLMVNVHILKHSLGVGIGLRQFCDYALAWRYFTAPGLDGHPEVDAEKYLDACRGLGILRWTAVLHEFINRYLPAPQGKAVATIPGRVNPETVENLFAMVMDGGNFGRYGRGRGVKRRRNALERKFSTMLSFMHNRFIFRLAPAEAVWTFTRLLSGQFH